MVCCQIADLDKASFAVLLVLSAAHRLVLKVCCATIRFEIGLSARLRMQVRSSDDGLQLARVSNGRLGLG